MAYAHVTVLSLSALYTAAKRGEVTGADDLARMANSAITKVAADTKLSSELDKEIERGDKAAIGKRLTEAGVKDVDPALVVSLRDAAAYFSRQPKAWPALLGAVAAGDKHTVADIGTQAKLPAEVVEGLQRSSALGGGVLGKLLVDHAISW
jgi:hypothetical protein